MKRRDFFKYTAASIAISAMYESLPDVGEVLQKAHDEPAAPVVICSNKMTVTNNSDTNTITLPDSTIVLRPHESATIDYDGETWHLVE